MVNINDNIYYAIYNIVNIIDFILYKY